VRVSVDPDLCQGHAACVSEAPEVFRFDHHKSPVVQILQPEPDADQHDAVRAAVRYCPTTALSLTEEDR
jgi:ferredoxin